MASACCQRESQAPTLVMKITANVFCMCEDVGTKSNLSLIVVDKAEVSDLPEHLWFHDVQFQ